ncbi:MAG: hypothetical protein JST84_00725 [Acidobacteria bacterium]|nr:hypothetical protein [Acidobacteriota bacterium]
MEASAPIQGCSKRNSLSEMNNFGLAFDEYSNCWICGFSLEFVCLIFIRVVFMKDCITKFSAAALFLLGSLSFAQPSQNPQPLTSQVAISDKTGKEAVCEGGAEIIPSGQQSFMRKRYSAANPKPKTKLTKSRMRK